MVRQVKNPKTIRNYWPKLKDEVDSSLKKKKKMWLIA
jgi:hypothetical protein